MHIRLKNIIVFLVVFTLFVLTANATSNDNLKIFAPNYFNEQNNIYDSIHYLENEHLSFEFCSNEDVKDITFTLKCDSSEEKLIVNNNYEKKGCYFSNYNLNNSPCDNFELNINYNINGKDRLLTRNFVKQRESLLINHILSKDYEDLNDLELSYYLIVLNNIQDKNNLENINVYEKLKNSRNNDNKCWPKNKCDLKTTLEILRNLKLAGYNSNSRLLEDGEIYIQRNVLEDPDEYIKEDEDEDYELELHIIDYDLDQDIECELKIDNDKEYNYDFDDRSDIDDLRVYRNFDENFEFICDYEIKELDLLVYKENIHDKTNDDEDNIEYTLSSYDKNDYSDFMYKIQIEHDFNEDEEIECDFTVDGKEIFENKVFDNDSDIDDLIIKDYFDDEIIFDCDDDFDTLRYDIYAQIKDEKKYPNEEEIEYYLNLDNFDKYDFEINFEYKFLNNEEIECELKIDNNNPQPYTFDEDDVSDNIVTIKNKKASSNIEFECKNKDLKNINLKVYDLFDRKQVDQDYKSVENIKYSIPSDFSDYICIGLDNDCKLENSINALNTFSSNVVDDSNKLENFVDSFINKGENSENFVYQEDKILDTGKYLFYKNNEDLVDFLKFNQNNDGSWGDDKTITNKVLQTSWATIGLQNAISSAEHIEDAKKWIYYNEPINGWSSIEKNTIAYIAIKEKLKPYLSMSIKNEIENITNFKIENPTIYNLKDIKVVLSNEINEYVSYTQDLGDLIGKESLEFNITLIKEIEGSKSGTFKITGVNGQNKEIELINIPINIKGTNPFDIITKNYSMSEKEKIIKIDKVNNFDVFSYDCTYNNPFNNEKIDLTINNGTSKIEVSNINQDTGDYYFDISCKNKETSFIIPINISITKPNVTISVTPENLIIENYNDFYIQVKNIGDKVETISMDIQGDYSGVIEPSEKAKVLAVNETRDIYFTITDPELLNQLSAGGKSEIILTTSSQFEKEIPISVFITKDNQEKGMSLFWYIGFAFVIFLIIGLFILRRMRMLQNQNDNEFHDADHEEEILLDDDF